MKYILYDIVYNNNLKYLYYHEVWLDVKTNTVGKTLFTANKVNLIIILKNQ